MFLKKKMTGNTGLLSSACCNMYDFFHLVFVSLNKNDNSVVCTCTMKILYRAFDFLLDVE